MQERLCLLCALLALLAPAIDAYTCRFSLLGPLPISLPANTCNETSRFGFPAFAGERTIVAALGGGSLPVSVGLDCDPRTSFPPVECLPEWGLSFEVDTQADGYIECGLIVCNSHSESFTAEIRTLLAVTLQ